jgi:hypothetical protein
MEKKYPITVSLYSTLLVIRTYIIGHKVLHFVGLVTRPYVVLLFFVTNVSDIL